MKVRLCTRTGSILRPQNSILPAAKYMWNGRNCGYVTAAEMMNGAIASGENESTRSRKEGR